MQNNKKFSGALLIGYSFDKDGNCLVTVGKQEKGKDVEIINAFSGDKAKALFDVLTNPKLQMVRRGQTK